MNFDRFPTKFKGKKVRNIRIVVICFLFLFLLLLILRSKLFTLNTYSRTKSPRFMSSEVSENPEIYSSPLKLPPTVVQALIHYTSSKSTPQQTQKEISITSKILQQKSPCNFLVFGLGYDSLMWNTLNHGGRTVFLEEDKSWIEKITRKFKELEVYHVVYDTRVENSEESMKIGKSGECLKVEDDLRFSRCKILLRTLNSDIYEIEWDLIMIDGPTGYTVGAPGRMGALYTAGMMARTRKSGDTDVFVHDVDRTVEDQFSREFLCDAYIKAQEGRLRHFNIPSRQNMSLVGRFCP